MIVTHEHNDHVKGVTTGAAQWGWKIYATDGNDRALAGPRGSRRRRRSQPAVRSISATSGWTIVGTSHDATEPIAIIATGSSTGVRAGIVYDLGVMTESVQRALERVDILILESNHDGEMLRNGPYPPSLKRRIASRQGHLSNRSAGIAAAECAHNGMSHVVLAHLSETNNTPRTATESMQAALRKTPFRGCVIAALQGIPSPTISAERAAAFGPAQLSLGL